MNKLILSIVFVLIVPNVVYSITIQDVTLKIVATQRYLSSEVSKHRTTIPAAISNARTVLRNRAEGIKSEIRAGPNSCNNWLSQIDSILQHQINFLYTFRTCEKTSEINDLDRIKYSLQDLMKSANQLIGLCAIIGNCQSNINSLYNGVLMVESTIGVKSSAITSSSARCITDKSASIDKSLSSSYDYWKKCANQ